jgi:hypothetical protein
MVTLQQPSPCRASFVWRLVCIACACQFALLEQAAAQTVDRDTEHFKTKTNRVLFAGSSSTYWNDMPNEIAKVISANGGMDGSPVTAEIVGRSGSDIRIYLDSECRYEYGVKRGQTFLDKVRDEAFDYVVLMVVCRFITGDGEDNVDGQAHAAAITQYCNAIRAANAEPVIYEMGWGKDDREAEGRRRILELAKRNRVRIYVPCSTAWHRVRQERPDLSLQHPNDNSHPGDLGHFLNMACFYAALKNESPVGKLPRSFAVWPHLSKVEKEAKKEELDAALASFHPDIYQSRLPEWMRRNAAAGYRGEVNDQDATYLERVAWETSRLTQPKLSSP